MKASQFAWYASTVMAVTMFAACSEQRSPVAPSALAPAAASPPVSVASAPAPKNGTANFEIKFMTGMIDHHQMAIEMAEICLAKAVHEELRAMCEDIIAAQSAEIEQMQTWLQEWYGITYEPTMKPGDEKMLERLASLSGAEFEIAFMEMMIEHHEKAIKEAERCVDKAAHVELRTLCENIIATQSAEIAQLQTWLCDWYGECQ